MTGRMTGPALLLLLAAAVAIAPLRPAHSQDDPLTAASVKGRIEQADSKRREAAAQDAEWLETGGLIDAARQALDRGELQSAANLADAALAQAELALQQAQREASAWQQRVIR